MLERPGETIQKSWKRHPPENRMQPLKRKEVPVCRKAGRQAKSCSAVYLCTQGHCCHSDATTRVDRTSPHTPLHSTLCSRGVTPPAPRAQAEPRAEAAAVTNSCGLPTEHGAGWCPWGHGAGVPSHREHLIRAFKGGSSESPASCLPC